MHIIIIIIIIDIILCARKPFNDNIQYNIIYAMIKLMETDSQYYSLIRRIICFYRYPILINTARTYSTHIL